MDWHLIAAVLVTMAASYLLGCCNTSIVISKYVLRDDVRNHGSGNAGLTNFYRTYGAKYALGVIALDMGKTVVAGLIGGYLFWFLRQDWTLGLLLAGIGCELGHMFPAFYGFKGGKGILCGGTLAWMLGWKVGLVAWGLFAALWLLSKYVSLGSVWAGASFPVVTFFVYRDPVLTLLGLLLGGLVVFMHRGNISRLLHGTENKFSLHHKKE